MQRFVYPKQTVGAKCDQSLLDDYSAVLPPKFQFGHLRTELLGLYDTAWDPILVILAVKYIGNS